MTGEGASGGVGDLPAELAFDLIAASLRSSSSDLGTFVEVLGDKLEQALPRQVKVDRRGARPFSKNRRVSRIDVTLGEERYVLDATGGAIETTRARAVRGVVLKTEALPLDEWLDDLARALAAEAGASELSRAALERLLRG